MATAPTFCTSSGLRPTLYAAEDTSSYESSKTANFGGNAQIGALSASGANTRSFLRFTLPSLNRCQVTTATLRIYASAPTGGRLIDAYRVDPTAPLWTELGPELEQHARDRRLPLDQLIADGSGLSFITWITDNAIGNIIIVVAVLLIHILIKPVANIKPSTILLPLVPVILTIPKAIRR